MVLLFGSGRIVLILVLVYGIQTPSTLSLFFRLNITLDNTFGVGLGVAASDGTSDDHKSEDVLIFKGFSGVKRWGTIIQKSCSAQEDKP